MFLYMYLRGEALCDEAIQSLFAFLRDKQRRWIASRHAALAAKGALMEKLSDSHSSLYSLAPCLSQRRE